MSVIDPMMESKHHLPECTLPKGHGDCICGELRAAEQRVTSDFAKYLRHMEEWQAGYNKGHAAGVEQGQRDERERIRTGVTGLPWEVAVSFGPIDCDYSCEEGPCGCSGVMRPEGWTTGLEDVLAVIDALKEGEPDVR